MGIFEIILVSTDTSKGIQVKKFNFDHCPVEYYAISYTWNYFDPWYLKHDYYDAKIISFHKKDFINLCKLYEQHISWLWIDAISMNQNCGDDIKKERKKTIYRMYEIYNNAKKVLAVPDLGYREYYEKHWINMETPRYEHDIEHSMRVSIIKRWIERTWVISERIIGTINNNLEVYFLTTNETKDIEKILQWEDIFIDKSDPNHPVQLLECIIESKCDKFVNRAIAILPLSKYRSEKAKFIEEDNIKTMKELKMRILDMLDSVDKILLVLRETTCGVLSGIKPTFITEYKKGEMRLDVYDNSVDWCKLSFDYHKQKITISGKYIQIDKDRILILMCSEYMKFVNIYEIHCLECFYNYNEWIVVGKDSKHHQSILNVGDSIDNLYVSYGIFEIF